MFKFFSVSSGDESVYTLVEPDKQNDKESKSPRRPRRYQSIHSAIVRKESSDSKSNASKTMGVPRVPVEDPNSFLKAHSKRPVSFLRPATVPSRSRQSKECQVGEIAKSKEANEEKVATCPKSEVEIQPKICSRPCTSIKKPPIPRGTLKLVIQPEKDYIKLNATNVIQMRPKVTTPRYVDTSYGTTREWLNSGIAPQYIHRKNYAHVPKYVLKRKNELIAQQKSKEEPRDAEPTRIRMLNPEEKDALINGLKKNWDEVFTLYQSMPLLIDTPGKIKRKSKLEVQLKMMEKDLQALQRHGNIFVADVDHYIYIQPKKM